MGEGVYIPRSYLSTSVISRSRPKLSKVNYCFISGLWKSLVWKGDCLSEKERIDVVIGFEPIDFEALIKLIILNYNNNLKLIFTTIKMSGYLTSRIFGHKGDRLTKEFSYGEVSNCYGHFRHNHRD
jgi:hypothetical protein